MEVLQDLPYRRLQLQEHRGREGPTGSLLRERRRAAYLRISVLKRPVGGHVFDDVSQDGIDLTFLGAGEEKS